MRCQSSEKGHVLPKGFEITGIQVQVYLSAVMSSGESIEREGTIDAFLKKMKIDTVRFMEEDEVKLFLVSVCLICAFNDLSSTHTELNPK